MVGSVANARALTPKRGFMKTLRLWIVLSWTALPTVMYGGYPFLRLIHWGDRLTPFPTTWFRAGHEHADVLLLMSRLYYLFLDQMTLGPTARQLGCAVMFVGILAQSGGFLTGAGAALPAAAVGVLVYGLVNTR